ncbi:MAG: UvrD-helicase domain-containing protein [Chlamydiota bacterium]|nr:UvrD-helicase domain-containing protein [Chlamydiota bacterium]
MNSFNVLHENLNIHKNYLLEASAGTGKTFSIENIVVRLLIENHPEQESPLKIEDILIVTFTKAATSDLKSRVRKNIEACMHALKSKNSERFGFLNPILAKGDKAIASTIAYLENALFCFDHSQIFTIHGFCSRMLRENVLEGNLRLDINPQEQLLPSETRAIVKNFLRTQITPSLYCREQINIVLKNHLGQYDKFESALQKLSEQGLPVKNNKYFNQHLTDFISAMDKLKNVHGFTKDKILSEYENLSHAYKKPKGVTDPDQSVQEFAELFKNKTLSKENFESIIKSGLVLYDALHPDNLKKKFLSNPPSEKYIPDLISLIEQELLPTINEARCPEMILTNMAHDCQKYLHKYCAEEEKLSFDDFLHLMNEAITHPSFLQNVQKKYTVAIIDEFQDTDPLQWNIFRSLFLEFNAKNKYLYLVGDPKQSIYSFRQADIYTYLMAAKALGKENIATLDTNFRSEPRLVDALNALFSESNCPEFITLPRTQSTIHYSPVKAGKEDLKMDFSDSMGNIHFFLADESVNRSNTFPLETLEQKYFFPFIVQEIQKLTTSLNLQYQQFAILISDRYQGERLSLFLNQYEIPFSLQRSSSLAESLALKAMKQLLQAILNPTNSSILKTGLGGPIIAFDHEKILSLNDPIQLEPIIEKIYQLRTTLTHKGFTAFFESLLRSTWLSDYSIQENLLKNKEGITFYDDLTQIAELLMEYESHAHPPPDALISYIDDFHTLQINDDARVRRRCDPQRDAVTIITMHSSKGLEYDIVFALGTVKRGSQPNQIITSLENEKRILKAVLSKEDPEYLEHCNEIDAEKMRQIYVAFTRAKYRLYIPFASVKNSRTQLGCASPVELFVAKMSGPYEDHRDLYDQINDFNMTVLEDFVSNENNISMEVIDPDKISFEKPKAKTKPILTPPKKIQIPGSDLFMQSFSSLTKSAASSQTKTTVESAPHNFLEDNKSVHTLPAGSETGNLLHLILETIDFESEDVKPHIEKFTRNTKYHEWTECIAHIVENTLNAEIEGFCLKNIPRQNTYRELEFVYPIDLTIPKIEEVDTQPGFLKGIIDLIFLHNGKYYIVDWKSNWLGSSHDNYNRSSMEESMNHHAYNLQAALYTEALKRYLSIVDDAPFEEIFGGAYYVFLRGVTKNRDQGVYAIDITKDRL